MIIGGVLKTRVVKHHPMGEANNSLHTNRHTDILRSVADLCNIHVLVYMTDCAEGLRTSVPSLHSVITPSDSHSSFDVASHFRHVGTPLSGKSMHTATNTIIISHKVSVNNLSGIKIPHTEMTVRLIGFLSKGPTFHAFHKISEVLLKGFPRKTFENSSS